MTTITAVLNERNGTVVKRVQIEVNWYVPPAILIDGDIYYVRTSPDSQADPLEFIRVTSVCRLPTS